MKKNIEIHNALKRRGYVNAEIIGLNNHIERLTNLKNNFEKEKKILDFELIEWDKFSNKTKT